MCRGSSFNLIYFMYEVSASNPCSAFTSKQPSGLGDPIIKTQEQVQLFQLSWKVLFLEKHVFLVEK